MDLGPAKSISVGETHACAVKLEGTVACWGSNDNGQSTVPSDLGRVTTVAAGGYNTFVGVMRGHSCAIKVSGQLVCWGSNVEGQIGIPADLGPVEQVGAGLAHTCVVKVDRTVVCWGLNNFGQATVPPGLGRVAQLSVGPVTRCVVRENGTVACWGRNSSGEFAVPTASFPSLSGATVDFGDSSGLDFGDVLAGSRSSVLRSVVSSTPGAAGVPLTIKSAALGSDGAGAFSVASPGCVPGRLADGASCSIGVRFTPRIWQRGVISGSLTVADDSEAGSHTIPLTGTAVEPRTFILQGVSATPGAGNVRFAWQSSDDAKLTVTVAQPVTSTVTRIVRGKKTTRKVTTIKPVEVLRGLSAPAGDSGWTWNRKVGATAAVKGTWDYSVTARSARGTLTRSGTVTLN